MVTIPENIRLTRARYRLDYARLVAPFTSYETYAWRRTVSHGIGVISEQIDAMTEYEVCKNIAASLPQFAQDRDRTYRWMSDGTGSILHNWLFDVMSLEDVSNISAAHQKILDRREDLFSATPQRTEFLAIENGASLFEGSHEFLNITLEGSRFVVEVAPHLFAPQELESRFIWSIIPWLLIEANPRTFYMYTGGDHERRTELRQFQIKSDAASFYQRRKAGELPYCSNDEAIKQSASECYQYAFRGEESPFNIEGVLKEYETHIAGLSDEDLDLEIRRSTGTSAAVNKMMSGQIYHDIWEPARLLINDSGSAANYKILVLCREWGKRYYQSERFIESVLPSEYAVKDKTIPRNSFVGEYSTTGSKEFAVSTAALTDDTLNSTFNNLIGMEYELRAHTCEEIFTDIIRPLLRQRDLLFGRCISKTSPESEYLNLKEKLKEIEIVLKEWFYRHAWLQAEPFPPRQEDVSRAFCAQNCFSRAGLSDYFHLDELGIAPIRYYSFSPNRNEILLQLFRDAGIGPGTLFADIACGATYDVSVIAASMGADVVASDKNSGNQSEEDYRYRPGLWKALVDGGWLTANGKPSQQLFAASNKHGQAPMMLRDDFSFGDSFPVQDRAATDLMSSILNVYHSGINEAKREAARILSGNGRLPSEATFLQNTFRRISWVSGKEGDVFNITFQRLLRAAMINGLIDVGAGGGRGCFGGPPMRMFGHDATMSILGSVFDKIESGGTMLVGIFQPDSMIGEYRNDLASFAYSRKDAEFDPHFKTLPRDSASLSWGGPHEGQMFVIHKK